MRRLLLALAITLASSGSAAAAEQSGVVTQISGPVIVTQGPFVSQSYSAGPVLATARGTVRSTQGAIIDACALYLKVWRNHTLIANSFENCPRNAGSAYFAKSFSAWGWPYGTRVTAQTWFDVRYRFPGGSSSTHRFTSPRAAIFAY